MGGPGASALDIEAQGVSLVYRSPRGDVQSLRDIDLAIQRGEFVSIVGPSGCGKSSFLKLVAGLHSPTGGLVRVMGEPVVRPPSGIGMVFQSPVLLQWRRVLGNVLFPADVLGRPRSESIEVARSLIALVGLEGFENRYPFELSGGMQQRVSLCRALIHQPALLMLDEPFAALDAFTREELWCVLRDLWHKIGFTVILVTHDLREAAFLADTIHVMSARPGRIVASRPVELARPRELSVCFEPGFGDLVHELRDKIAEVRRA